MSEARNNIDPVFSISLTSKNEIINVGLRVVVTSFLLDDGRFKHGKVVNISNNEVKIFVYGTQKDTQDMLNNLKNKLSSTGGDKSFLVPGDIEVGEPQLVGTNPHPMTLPLLTDFAQSLMLEQTGKGVCVMSKGFDSLGNKFDNMANFLKKYLEKS